MKPRDVELWPEVRKIVASKHQWNATHWEITCALRNAMCINAVCMIDGKALGILKASGIDMVVVHVSQSFALMGHSTVLPVVMPKGSYSHMVETMQVHYRMGSYAKMRSCWRSHSHPMRCPLSTWPAPTLALNNHSPSTPQLNW